MVCSLLPQPPVFNPVAERALGASPPASLFEGVAPSFSELIAYDRLTTVSYRPEKLIESPLQRIGGELYLAELVPLAWGVYATGFKPADPRSQKPPILVFPGTSPTVEGGLKGATLLADLDPMGPGYSLARESESAVRAWLEDAGGRAVVVGHSLGGALATQAAVRCPGLVSRVVSFNAPMVARSIARSWRETPDSERAAIYNYFRKGDLVARLGPEEIGSSFEVDAPGSHNTCLFFKKTQIPAMSQVNRKTSSWIHVAGVFVALSLAFLTLGTLVLIAHVFGLPSGLNLAKETPIFRPSPKEAVRTPAQSAQLRHHAALLHYDW